LLYAYRSHIPLVIMKSIKLYYNPTAGEGENSKEDLVQHIKEAGYEFINSVHKNKGLQQIEKDTDILAVAGGDGTVRKACLELLETPLKDSRPIGLLALGTANNIASTLKIQTDVAQVIQSWNKHKLKRFDVGRVDGYGASEFFIESFGFGIFPRLIKKMKKLESHKTDTPKKEFETALLILIDLVRTYETVPCSIIIDGKKDHTGNYIMVEVMNIRSLGPRLVLAPEADPGDGYFDVLLVSERQREQLINYIEKISRGVKGRFPFKTIKGRNIQINWSGKDVHIDDQLIKKYKPAPLEIKLLDAMIDFLVSDNTPS
jgi:diacylglycerol kinase (ATP)